MTAKSSTLWTEQLGKSYGGRRVVNGVSLKMNQGEVVGLLGPNGAGKTTTFYMIVGLTSPDSGRILLNRTDITDVPMYLRARAHRISYLPQEPSVFRKLTVEENIMAVLEAQSLSWHERRERMEKLIDQLGLGYIRRNRGYALSGGERRRVEHEQADARRPFLAVLAGVVAHHVERPVEVPLTSDARDDHDRQPGEVTSDVVEPAVPVRRRRLRLVAAGEPAGARPDLPQADAFAVIGVVAIRARQRDAVVRRHERRVVETREVV